MAEFNFSSNRRGRPPGSRNRPKENSFAQFVEPYNWKFADADLDCSEDVDPPLTDGDEDATQSDDEIKGISINFINVLQKVKSDALNHYQHLAKNEGATRTTLVDPLLRALGWEMSNPNSVIVEARARRGTNTIFADYALMNGSSARFIVEAKSLGQDLKLHRNQVVDYAFAFQINNVFLTNGIIWEHYTNLNPKLLAPTTILNIETGDLKNIAAYLTQELHATPALEEESMIADLYEKAEELTAKLEGVLSRISSLEIAGKRCPLTLNLQSRITTLLSSSETSTQIITEEYNQLEDSPLANEIIRLMEERTFYQATPTQLMDLINDHALPENKDSDSWPRNARWFSTAIQKLVPSLRQSGIDIKTGRSAGARYFKIRKMNPDSLQNRIN